MASRKKPGPQTYQGPNLTFQGHFQHFPGLPYFLIFTKTTQVFNFLIFYITNLCSSYIYTHIYTYMCFVGSFFTQIQG